MKTAYIIHGWGSNPKEAMPSWIKAELEKKDYRVVSPEMPKTDEPEINAWVSKIKEITDLNSDSLFIGHSIGCQAILRFIETLSDNQKISKIILIAPWMELDMNTIEKEGQEVINIAKPWMESPINFSKIKSRVDEIIAIFSDNDPYVPLRQRGLFERELGAIIIIQNNKGHFTESDHVTDLPVILNLI